MKISIAYDFLAKQKTTRTCQVMDHFGIGFETGQHVIVDEFTFPLTEGQIVCFTGDSGSGKSSLLRAAAGQVEKCLFLDELELPTGSLVDGLPVSLAEGLEICSACGLSEAQLLLRTPQELSDGQRYRYRLALAIARQPLWIVADEFSASLDRTLAKVIAANLQRISRRWKIGFLLATTHEDILEDLQPDRHIRCRLGTEPVLQKMSGGGDVEEATEPGGRKKKGSASCQTSGSVPVPNGTGRISLGGITAAITSVSSKKSICYGI